MVMYFINTCFIMKLDLIVCVCSVHGCRALSEFIYSMSSDILPSIVDVPSVTLTTVELPIVCLSRFMARSFPP